MHSLELKLFLINAPYSYLVACFFVRLAFTYLLCITISLMPSAIYSAYTQQPHAHKKHATICSRSSLWIQPCHIIQFQSHTQHCSTHWVNVWNNFAAVANVEL